jgi:hypothetical protein
MNFVKFAICVIQITEVNINYKNYESNSCWCG